MHLKAKKKGREGEMLHSCAICQENINRSSKCRLTLSVLTIINAALDTFLFSLRAILSFPGGTD
jgi:hypothetical protein